ncbi:hypothetical protein OIE43_44560 [Streptomyces pseudovenezuelae]|uniref:hypothetical protein n=1 Tax=Streptomyces pseudovenezuelae TaxID=67350 RepID=UPI002E2EB426|nr:hypothetical protein [Streptomyces pseudovenezuelae]
MSRFGAGIRRGVMAADQFTQIANGLFRDDQLSFKAKGIFGYVSTHANGWQVTIADLVRLGPDGREAVRTGLKELEAHGYLIRERLRRPDGTLGEIVYCITDRPATLDIALIEADLASASPEARHADGFGAGIRRGVMAADQFTQIANGLFHARELSYKAKGLFGLLSTHREGWRMTVTDITRRGRDGESAVKSGLKELEKHGFLVRERERGEDGTLGAAAYVITDLPALQTSRSQPESGFPPMDDPTLADRPTKNTNRKKTTQQNTRPLPPRARAAGPRGEAPPGPRTEPPAPADLEPGVRLLLAIGAQRPELLLTDQVLAEQGRTLTAMLDAGWTREQLQHVISDRPLPNPVRTTVGAIIAARLRAAQAYPPPATVADHYDSPAWEDPPPRSTTSSAARTVSEALTYRALVECAGCGVPGTAPGEDLCPACLGWPSCRTCPGPTPRRAHPDGDGRCSTCASAFVDHLEGSTP